MELLFAYSVYTVLVLLDCLRLDSIRYKILSAYALGTILGGLVLLYFKDWKIAAAVSVLSGLIAAAKMVMHP